MQLLRLIALDPEDLTIVSSYVQDSLLKIKDFHFSASSKSVLIAINRSLEENDSSDSKEKLKTRWRSSILDFRRVLAVESLGIQQEKKEKVFSLIGLHFHPLVKPEGTISLLFPEKCIIRLRVECVEARLFDMEDPA